MSRYTVFMYYLGLHLMLYGLVRELLWIRAARKGALESKSELENEFDQEWEDFLKKNPDYKDEF